MGYLCANFSLSTPLCSRVRPDVRDRRQTDRRQTKASLNASALWRWGHNKGVDDVKRRRGIGLCDGVFDILTINPLCTTFSLSVLTAFSR